MKKRLQPLFKLACLLLLLITVAVSCTKEIGPAPEVPAEISDAPVKLSVTATVPSIVSLQPNRGRIGDSVVITGINFSAKIADNVVKFNGVTAVVKSATIKSLLVIAPKSSTGNVTLKVKTVDVKSPPKFTYLLPVTASSIKPATGKEGDVITITGTNFSTVKAENVVKFSGVPATVSSASTTQLKVTVPKGAKTGNVTLVVITGAPVAVGAFTVTNSDEDWADVKFSGALQEHVISVTAGKGIMFTGGLKPKFLYYSPDGLKYTDVYTKLPFKDKATLELHLLASDENTAGGPTYYLTSNQGIAKTQNGTTWTLLSPGGTPTAAGGFTGIIARNNNVFLLSNSRLYESHDAGKTWKVNASATGAGLDYITSDQNGKYWYAVDVKNNATDKVKKMYRSTDYGKTWMATRGSTGRYFYDNGTQDFFHISGYSLFCLYNSTNSLASGQKLYTSTDQGDTWKVVNTTAQNFVKTSGPIVVYGGKTLSVSTDGGATFETGHIPAGYTISGIDIGGGYAYAFAYNSAGVGKTKIFRQKAGN